MEDVGDNPLDTGDQEAASLWASWPSAPQHAPPLDPPPSTAVAGGEWHCDTCQRSWAYPHGYDFLMAHGIFGDLLVYLVSQRVAARAGAIGGPNG